MIRNNKLGFGMMRLPVTNPSDAASVDFAQLEEMADLFIASGFTYFDSAYIYHGGMSDVAIKKTLIERYDRDAFTLANKMPTFMVSAASDFDRYFSEQAERTGADYFDYYLLHDLDENNYANMRRHGGFEYVRKLKEQGRAKCIGFSFHDKAEVLDKILTEHPEMEYVQLQINYVDWESPAIESRKCYETAVKHGKPVIVMEPLKGGALVNIPAEAEKILKAARPSLSAASWGIRFAASLPGVIMVLSGMSTLGQVKNNVSIMKEFQALTEPEKEVIEQVREIIAAATAVPCTDCRYCADSCPQSIPIPDYFSLYNSHRLFGFNPIIHNYYRNLTLEYGKASDCVTCGQCAERCPQHIEIPEELVEVAKTFE
ncbi:MAG: aldo/keto reductase [Syntrophomonadaceae bacterium]|jgi:predicted aldo/keto reductase-like oxidoreductase|nr:aldo/keto reductase [Syntrophomonadaceae bacterium]